MHKTKKSFLTGLYLLMFLFIFSYTGVQYNVANINEKKDSNEIVKEEEYIENDKIQEENIEYKNIITVQEFQELKKLKDVVIIDFSKERLYKRFIPEAVEMKDEYLVKKEKELMVNKEVLERVLGDLGIENKDTVVIYDNDNMVRAIQLWYIMKIYGHTDVKILNGGFSAWKKEKLPVSASLIKRPPTDYEAKEPNLDFFVDLEKVKTRKTNKNLIFIDTRSKRNWKKGHIPDAIPMEYKKTLNRKGTFIDIEELTQLYKDNGILKEKEIIIYDEELSKAMYTAFVLKELLDYEKVFIYDFGWEEYRECGEPIIKK